MKKLSLFFWMTSVAALAAGCVESGDGYAPDASEAEIDELTEEVSCKAQLTYYPVRGKHNNGYDSSAGKSSTWTCDDAKSNSDFSAGDHLGNDIWAAEGTPVVATVSGKLTLTGWSDYSGNKVTIVDDCGWYHFYAHLKSIAPGVVNGKRVKAGDVVGTVGKTGTAANGVVHLHYSIYPSGDYDAAIDPWPALHAVEKNVCNSPSGGGSSGGGTKKHWVDTFADAPGYSSPGGSRTGTLKKGTNYVFCKVKGPKVQVGSDYNTWWLKTDLDTGSSWKNQYVSAYYLARWGNDVAKDNDGKVIPTCD